MATDIIEELHCLPIHMATAVKYKCEVIWHDFLCTLKCRPQLNMIWSKEAKLCLLICSMFPKKFGIPIEDLVMYGMGLELFTDVHDMLEARYRVVRLIDIINFDLPPLYEIKLHCEDEYVKMLDLGYDLATRIASRHRLFFRHDTIMDKWPKPNSYKDCYGLSLVLKNITSTAHSVYFKCPRLAVLQLRFRHVSQIIPAGFFKGMNELRVLSLDVRSLPQSVDVLKNLRTLLLKVHSSEDISVIGSLTNLEFVSISSSCLVDIPREMGQLANLRFLNLSEIIVAYIPGGVLSRMLKLEEMYMPLRFTRWGCRAEEEEEDDQHEQEVINTHLSVIDDRQRINASLTEIGSLSLKALQISVRNASTFLKNSSFFKHIWRFRILMLNNFEYDIPFGRVSMNELQLTGDSCDIKESGICDLLSRTDKLSLTRVRNLKSVMCLVENYHYPHLKKMIISECDELEYVVSITEDWISLTSFGELERLHLSMLSNLKQIWHGPRPTVRWFSNLSQINIRFCHRLRHVFPLSMARRLKQLKSIEIIDCHQLEGIFYKDNQTDNTGNFTIRDLHLHSLPNLVAFLAESEDGTTNHPLTINEASHIKNEGIISDTEMYRAFSSSKLMDKSLESLERLKLAFCDALEVVFSFNENHANSRVFNSLKELELYGLRNLMHIWCQIPLKLETTSFQRLQILIISDCHNLYLLSPGVANMLVQLQTIQISRCEKLEDIVLAENEKGKEKEIVFPQLKTLELQYMPNLRIFYGGISTIELPLLEFLKLNQCSKMKSFSRGLLVTPLLKRVQVDGGLHPLKGDLNATMKQ